MNFFGCGDIDLVVRASSFLLFASPFAARLGRGGDFGGMVVGLAGFGVLRSRRDPFSTIRPILENGLSVGTGRIQGHIKKRLSGPLIQ